MFHVLVQKNDLCERSAGIDRGDVVAEDLCNAIVFIKRDDIPDTVIQIFEAVRCRNLESVGALLSEINSTENSSDSFSVSVIT